MENLASNHDMAYGFRSYLPTYVSRPEKSFFLIRSSMGDDKVFEISINSTSYPNNNTKYSKFFFASSPRFNLKVDLWTLLNYFINFPSLSCFFHLVKSDMHSGFFSPNLS